MEWVLVLGGVIGGMVIGYWLGFSTGPAKHLGAELKQAKEELSSYRDKVTQHFSRTAELVEVLASNSREIYRHLATGSQELCDPDAIRLSDTVFKALPERTVAGEAASEQEETKAAETAEVSAPAEAPQAEATPAPETVEGERPAAAQGNGGEAAAPRTDAQPSDATTESQGEAKEAGDSSAKSEWVELIPQMEEKKEQPRLH